MIVADTNLVVYYILPTVHTERAQRRRKLDRDWRVPRLFQHELTNALTRYLSQKVIDRDEAIALHRMAMSLVTVEHEPIPAWIFSTLICRPAARATTVSSSCLPGVWERPW